MYSNWHVLVVCRCESDLLHWPIKYQWHQFYNWRFKNLNLLITQEFWGNGILYFGVSVLPLPQGVFDLKYSTQKCTERTLVLQKLQFRNTNTHKILVLKTGSSLTMGGWYTKFYCHSKFIMFNCTVHFIIQSSLHYCLRHIFNNKNKSVLTLAAYCWSYKCEVMQLREHCKNIKQNLSLRMMNDYKKLHPIPSLRR